MSDHQDPNSQPGDRRYVLLGTAGHIDHGKTALVRALTGVDTDRLPEEKQRGMTIELGFAHLDLENEQGAVRFGVVDVPGHERFVRTMVAGATAIDVVLLVVAADDSVMPQTREHVDIIKLLGVRRGVVAVSKCDLVDPEMIELVCEEVRELLAGSVLDSCKVVPVSAVSGQGLSDLRSALVAEGLAVQRRRRSEVFRLSIDRVFTVHGRGTVVTGSALSGTVAVGDNLVLLPDGCPCKVRGLQSHFDQADALQMGQRVAVNVTGIDKHDAERGDELATPGHFQPATFLDVALQALASNARPLKHLQTVRLCLGTGESLARLRLFAGPLQAGDNGFAQLVTRRPVVAEFGQHYIIRDETDSRTLGGGSVLRPVSRLLSRRDRQSIDSLAVLRDGDDLDRLEEVIRFDQASRRGWTFDELQAACRSGIQRGRIAGCLQQLQAQGRVQALSDAKLLVSSRMVADCCEAALARLRQFHEKHADEPGYPADEFKGWLNRRWGPEIGGHVFEQLRDTGFKSVGRFCCLPQFAPKMSADEQRVLQAMVDEYHAAAFQPPAVAALKSLRQLSEHKVNKLSKIAVATGQLVQIAPDLVIHADRLEELRRHIAGAAGSQGLTVAEVRTLLDSSRKFVVPLLEYLDKVGYTKRIGDRRVVSGQNET